LYRVFTAGHYPYGEIEPFTHPRFTRPAALLRRRPDLPPWLDAVLARVLAPEPAARFGDALELALELEAGLARGAAAALPPRRPLYDRDPVAFWRTVAMILLVALLAALVWR